MRKYPRQRFLLALLLLAVLSAAQGCSGDSGTIRPEPETDSGFVSEYRRGECLGVNGCVREGDGFASVYENEVWCDWWDTEAPGVDSAVFFLTIRVSVWRTPGGLCSCDEMFTALRGERFGYHWRAYSPVGYWMFHPGLEVYSCCEFLPEPVHVRVVYEGGEDSTFTAQPTPR
jgi:hypothetical protein